ncbi:hypothetical protein BHF68_05770 [Desulfuribacillus alkaliarsenatis]|uniref:Major facilitator superfamily (MFS) profile domain-containing protein n=2 Tax=Desulfuribacillus alkaliarsenatis TaxID=766136 RepID=A0A1E5G2M5_9FIRM|nr:hypothetical protein BHF68_05770 [Desulfuribacillus alkaliarsenatis]
MLGYGIGMPVLPFYIEQLGGGGLQLGLLIAAYGVMQLIFAPVWGSLSDRYGRKPILMVGMTGLGLGMLLFGLSHSLWMLYMAQLISGALACAMFPVAMAYISDSTSEENRSGAMGKIGAAAGLGIVIGPGIGGLLATNSLSTPFFVAASVCFFTVLVIMIGLPETLTKASRNESVDKIEFLQIRGLWQALYTPIAFGLFAIFAVYFGKTNFSSIYGLYALERFGYGPQEVGSILMIMSLVYLIAQGFIVGPLTKKYGEQKVIKWALLGNAIGFILMLIADAFIWIVLTISFFILLNALLKPAALAFISKNSTMKQGKAMGFAESYMSVGRIIGPIWAGAIFDVNMSFPFISGALFFLLMFLISLSYSDETDKRNGLTC